MKIGWSIITDSSCYRIIFILLTSYVVHLVMAYKRVYLYLLYFIALKFSLSNTHRWEPVAYRGSFPEVGVLPHVVHVTTATKSFHCTGTIINETWVITAAHCFYDKQNRINVADLEVSKCKTNITSTWFLIIFIELFFLWLKS